LALTLTFGLVPGEARGQQPEGPVTVEREARGDNVREITAPSQTLAVQPAISFIESPSDTCYKPDPTQDACCTNWYYNSVSASPDYNYHDADHQLGGHRGQDLGVFPGVGACPVQQLGEGFKVLCGALGSGGNPDLGATHAWTIRVRDSAGLSSANYGTVYCPFHGP
jgi:hypothetical protein